MGYSVIKKILPVNENITNKIEKLLPAAIDCVNVSIPKYMSYLLPLAINKIRFVTFPLYIFNHFKKKATWFLYLNPLELELTRCLTTQAESTLLRSVKDSTRTIC